ncbi:MAG: helix-turn-helix domain-containing protein [Pseudomonadota bacterium]
MTTQVRKNGVARISDEKGVPIRAVVRAFDVLGAINRVGNPNIMELAQLCQLPYATVFRIVATLVHDGWVEAEPGRKRYRPTERVLSLASGFQTHDLLVANARDHIVELTAKTHWPVTLSIRVGSSMMVKDSTHTLTSQTLANYYPGYTLPLTDCAAGKAYLAFCDEQERRIFLESLREDPDPDTRWLSQIFNDDNFLQGIRDRGFSTHARVFHTESPGKTSAIAVPILVDGVLQATLALVYFEVAMKESEAVATYVEPLKMVAERIAQAMDAHKTLEKA